MKLREMKLLYLELISKSSTTKIFINLKLPAPLSMKHWLGHRWSYIYIKKVDQTWKTWTQIK